MKKVKTIAIILIVLIFAASCTQHTCPTYAKKQTHSKTIKKNS